jgi:predicted small integral membrane protein
MLDLSWMAWTWPTATFFLFILFCLLVMAVWEHYSPGGNPRNGILGLDTTRGDRLFISILGSIFISLGWLAAFSTPLWGAVIISIFYTIFVFKWV